MFPSRFITGSLAAELSNLDNSGGLIPLKLGPAFIETEEHLLLIQYDLRNLQTSLDKLDNIFQQVKRNNPAQNQSQTYYEYIESIETTLETAKEKAKNLKPRQDLTKGKQRRKEELLRKKRGLINGLGTVVKFITGNLDDNDRKKYDKLIRKLTENNAQTNAQLNQEHRVLTNLIQKYNDTIDMLNKNNREITVKLRDYAKTASEPRSAKLRAIASQMLINANIILNQQREIETSLSFCKLGITHPSIIPLHAFESELVDIVRENVNNNIKLFNSTIEYELNSKVICSLYNEQIIYIIKIPVYLDKKLQLFLLQPVPIRRNNDFVTILPQSKYVITDSNLNINYSTNQLCYKNNDRFYCTLELLSPCKRATNCSQNILKHNTLQGCQFTKIKISDPYYLIIPETGHVVITSLHDIPLEDKRPNGNSRSRIKGTWIIKPTQDTIILDDQPILITSTAKSNLRVPFIQTDELLKTQVKPLELNLQDYSNIPDSERWSFLNTNNYNHVNLDYVHLLTSPLYIIILCLTTTLMIRWWLRKRKPQVLPIISQPVTSPFPIIFKNEVPVESHHQ